MRGEVLLRVECLTPERLLERAFERGARFDSIRRAGDRVLLLSCDGVSADTVAALCGRFSIPVKVLRRRGGSALSRFARRRATLPVGILLAVLMSMLFLGRIWRVDIAFSGENAGLGDRAALEAALQAAGIRPGVPTRSVDARRLGEALRAGAGDYSYVGAHLQGVRLSIEAVPESPPPPLYDVEAARDLVSDRDGVVVSAVARSGELCVKPGDVIRRGQLLIRGEEKASAEETRPIAALGEVIVRCWREGGASLPATVSREEYTGRESVSAKLVAAGLEWPIAVGEDYPGGRTQTEYLPVGGLFLPVELVRSVCREVKTEAVPADIALLRARLAALALADAALQLRREPEPFEVTDRWIDYENTGDSLRANAVYEIQANAAVTREELRSR